MSYKADELNQLISPGFHLLALPQISLRIVPAICVPKRPHTKTSHILCPHHIPPTATQGVINLLAAQHSLPERYTSLYQPITG